VKFDSDEDDGDDDKLMNDDGLGDDYSLDMAEAYRSSLLGKAMTTIQEVKDKSERGELAVDESLKQEYASSWLKQFFVLSFRNLRDLGRNPMVRIRHDTHGTQPTTLTQNFSRLSSACSRRMCWSSRRCSWAFSWVPSTSTSVWISHPFRCMAAPSFLQ
jgi:hypothetical protein